jgi:G3E family GTPase
MGIASDVQKEEKLFEIHRLKGILNIDDGTIKFVQGVREVFEIKDAEQKREYTETGVVLAKEGKLVLIGRNIERASFGTSFLSAIERSGP